MGSTMRIAGSSITVTSISDAVAFMSCLGNSLPVIRAVCGFGAIAVLIDFAYQVTGFVAMLTFAHDREETAKADCLCCVPVRKPELTCRGRVLDRVKPSALQRFLQTTYSDAILSKVGKCTIILLAVSLLGVSCWKAPQIEADNDFKW